MARYIDRTELECDTEWSDYEDGFVSYSKFQIETAPIADVVERSKYEEVIKEAEELSKAYSNERGKYKDLRSKIDKAIKEIEEIKSVQYNKGAVEHGMDKALEIIKRNIGD